MLTYVSLFSFEGKLYLVGGDYITSLTADIYLFHPENATVTQVGALSVPMKDPVLILFNI